MSDKTPRSVRQWDLPTRLFHWCLVLLIAAAWYTGENAQIDRHEPIGIALFVLILFRVIWGFVGSETARFTHFIKSPIKAVQYLLSLVGKGPSHEGPHAGHNPAGGWMVIALLLLVGFQAFSGLASNENTYLFYDGPLLPLVGYELSDKLTSWHHISFDLLLILIGVHVAVVMFYLFVKKDNLVRPMVLGRKQVEERFSAQFDGLKFVTPLRALIALGVAGGSLWALIAAVNA